jgi:predicted ester cyclase
MVTEKDIALARRWFLEGWTGNLDLAAAVFSDALAWNGVHVGIAGPKQTVAARLTGFPDLVSRIEEQIVQGDAIVTRALWSGTHRGVYNGIAPTGRHVEDILSLAIWHMRAGRVVEVWSLPDQTKLLQQLGVLPESLRTALVGPP